MKKRHYANAQTLAAFSDDQLEGTERAGVAVAVAIAIAIAIAIASDPVLAQQIKAHRVMNIRLRLHLASTAQESVPDQLAALPQP